MGGTTLILLNGDFRKYSNVLLQQCNLQENLIFLKMALFSYDKSHHSYNNAMQSTRKSYFPTDGLIFLQYVLLH